MRLHVLQDVLALEDVEVGQGHRAADRVPGERGTRAGGGPRFEEGLHEAVRGGIIAPRGAYPEVRPLATVMMSG